MPLNEGLTVHLTDEQVDLIGNAISMYYELGFCSRQDSLKVSAVFVQAMAEQWPEVASAAERAADAMLAQQIIEGKRG